MTRQPRKTQPRPKNDKCTFEKKRYFDEPDPDEDGVIIRRPYMACTLDEEDAPCPFPVRLCRFKAQQEDAEMLISAGQGEISETKPTEE